MTGDSWIVGVQIIVLLLIYLFIRVQRRHAEERTARVLVEGCTCTSTMPYCYYCYLTESRARFPI